jgi:hypothetical protein
MNEFETKQKKKEEVLMHKLQMSSEHKMKKDFDQNSRYFGTNNSKYLASELNESLGKGQERAKSAYDKMRRSSYVQSTS